MFKDGALDDWDAVEAIYDHAFRRARVGVQGIWQRVRGGQPGWLVGAGPCPQPAPPPATPRHQLRLVPDQHPLLMAEPSITPRPVREKMVSLLFEKFGAPGEGCVAQACRWRRSHRGGEGGRRLHCLGLKPAPRHSPLPSLCPTAGDTWMSPGASPTTSPASPTPSSAVHRQECGAQLLCHGAAVGAGGGCGARANHGCVARWLCVLGTVVPFLRAVLPHALCGWRLCFRRAGVPWG